MRYRLRMFREWLCRKHNNLIVRLGIKAKLIKYGRSYSMSEYKIVKELYK